MDKKIQFLDIISNEDKTYVSAKVIYSDGKEENVYGDDEVIAAIAKFSIQEHNSELLDDTEKVRVIVENKELSPDVELPKEEIKSNIKNDENSLKPEKSEHKGKKVAIGVSGLALVGVLTFFAIKGFKGFSNTKSSAPSTTMEQSIDNNRSITIEEKGEKTPYNGSLYMQNIKNIAENDDLILRARNYLAGNYTSYYELMSICDGISMRSGANMNELANLLNGGRMNGDYCELSLESMFNEDSFDYVAVHEFCTRRNSIVRNAYNQNINESRNQVKNYLDFFVDFLYNGKTMQGSREFDYLDLNKLSQFDIINLGLQMLTTCNDYSKTIHGRVYNAQELSNKIYNDYYGFLMEDLEASIIKSY